MIVFGSRGSDLALTQTRCVAEWLRTRTGEESRIEVIKTRGDLELQRPLSEIGGKGLFTAELEAALREGRVDCAVHSLKDLPVEDPEGLVVGAIPIRASVRDVLICRPDAVVAGGAAVPLIQSAKVGTSSLRREGVLRRLRPDLDLCDIRGNVPTRVGRVRDGDYDAVVLAAAGLDRLGLDLGALVRIELPLTLSPAAPGQGALGVQCRADDARVRGLLASIDDAESAACANLERRLLLELGGGCSMPLGAVAVARGDSLELSAGLFAGRPAEGGVFRRANGSDPDGVVAELVAEFAPIVHAPLAGRAVAITRVDGVRGPLDEYLGVAGADVTRLAVLCTERIELRDDAARAVEGPHVLAFTSSRAVHHFFEQNPPGDPRAVFAVGAGTAAAVAEFGERAQVADDARGGAALARLVLETVGDDVAIVFPCAEDRNGDFERTVRAAGRDCRLVPVYRALASDDALPSLERRVVVVTSGASVRALMQRVGSFDGEVVAFGESAAAALCAAGIAPAAVTEPNPAALLAALLEVES